MSLIDPATGNTILTERLLELLPRWTRDPQVLRVLLARRIISRQQVIVMAHRIQATLTGKPPEWKLGPLALAVMAVRLLANRDVRRVIAKRTFEETREAHPEATPASALQALLDLKRQIEEEFRLDAKEEQWEEARRMEQAGLVSPSGPAAKQQKGLPAAGEKRSSGGVIIP